MKLGIITDIHSNVQALNIILKEFDKLKVDIIICCGDIIGIGPYPEKTVQTLIQRKDTLIAVRGNHERYLLEGVPKEIHDDKRKMSIDEIKQHEWNHGQLSETSKLFLNDLQILNTIQIESKKIYIVHYPINENGEFKNFIKKPNINENKEMFKGIDADIFLYGHTHFTCINNENGKWYINSGSLGCPMKNINIARAGILDIDGNEIHYNQLNIEYNVNEVIKEIERLKFPSYEEILKTFYGKKAF